MEMKTCLENQGKSWNFSLSHGIFIFLSKYHGKSGNSGSYAIIIIFYVNKNFISVSRTFVFCYSFFCSSKTQIASLPCTTSDMIGSDDR